MKELLRWGRVAASRWVGLQGSGASLAASRLHLGGSEVDAFQHGGEVAVLAHAAVLAHGAPVVHGPALVRAEEPAEPEHLARAQEAVAHLVWVLIRGDIARGAQEAAADRARRRLGVRGRSGVRVLR